MLRKASKLPTYNGGVAEFFRDRRERTSFGAPVGPAAMGDLEPVARLCFKAQPVREQDMEFAERRGSDFSAKIRTHPFKGLDAGCMALIDGRLYSVSYIDRTPRDMFIYLEGGEEFG